MMFWSTTEHDSGAQQSMIPESSNDKRLTDVDIRILLHMQSSSIPHFPHRRRNQGDRGAVPPPPPNILPSSTTCSADRRVAVYITFGLPKMELLPTPIWEALLNIYSQSSTSRVAQTCKHNMNTAYI